MTPETITEYGTYFDEVFFLIGGALLAIELLKGLFTRSMKGRELLDMLMLWRSGSVESLIRRVKAEFGRVVTKDEIGEATHFLISNALVRRHNL